jgi:hypothetical protein
LMATAPLARVLKVAFSAFREGRLREEVAFFFVCDDAESPIDFRLLPGPLFSS